MICLVHARMTRFLTTITEKKLRAIGEMLSFMYEMARHGGGTYRG